MDNTFANDNIIFRPIHIVLCTMYSILFKSILNPHTKILILPIAVLFARRKKWENNLNLMNGKFFPKGRKLKHFWSVEMLHYLLFNQWKVLLQLSGVVFQQCVFTFVKLKLCFYQSCNSATYCAQWFCDMYNLHIMISLSTKTLILCYFPVQLH